MTPKLYDAIVVGAGPAGSTAAKELSQRGCEVLLLDKSKFPRKKTCGGLVPVKALEELDFSIPKCYIKNKITSLSIYNQKMEYTIYKNNGVLAITTLREEFDHHLLNRAIGKGTIFNEETALEKVERKDKYLEITTNKGIYKSKHLIGCDGVFSKVRKFVDGGRNQKLFKMGFTLSADLPYPKGWPHTEFKLYQIPVLYTMGWAIPCSDHVNVGIGGPWINKNKILKFFHRYIEELSEGTIKRHDYILKGGFLPAGGLYRKIYDKGVLLAGDAGGFVDPLTGEGLYYAIRSGKIAADKILEGKTETYENTCYSEFNSTLRRSLVKNLVGINKIYSRSSYLRERLCESFSNTMH